MAAMISLLLGFLKRIPIKGLILAAVIAAFGFGYLYTSSLKSRLEAAELRAQQEHQKRIDAERTSKLLIEHHNRVISVLERERDEAEARSRRLQDTRQRIERAEDGEVAPVLKEALEGLRND